MVNGSPRPLLESEVLALASLDWKRAFWEETPATLPPLDVGGADTDACVAMLKKYAPGLSSVSKGEDWLLADGDFERIYKGTTLETQYKTEVNQPAGRYSGEGPLTHKPQWVTRRYPYVSSPSTRTWLLEPLVIYADLGPGGFRLQSFFHLYDLETGDVLAQKYPDSSDINPNLYPIEIDLAEGAVPTGKVVTYRTSTILGLLATDKRLAQYSAADIELERAANWIALSGMADLGLVEWEFVSRVEQESQSPAGLPAPLLLTTPGPDLVAEGALGADDGSSWQDAFPSLRAALAQASGPVQIWVAEGVSLPSSTGNRDATFHLTEGLEVYGGFDGTETHLAHRAGLFQSTILSGDLAGNDGPTFSGRAENSYHVLSGEGLFVPDGFLIQGGNANGPLPASRRGGAGYFAEPAFPLIDNCWFIANQSLGDGGAIYAGDAGSRYRDCVFQGNRSRGSCGAYFMEVGGPGVSGFCNCRFLGNSAGGLGGGGYSGQTLVAVGCVFCGNSCDDSSQGGGAVRCGYDCRMVNSTIYGNNAVGAGIGTGGVLIVSPVPPSVWNTIAWDDVDSAGSGQHSQIHQALNTLPAVDYHSCIQGWDGSSGNAWNPTAAPDFVDPDGVDDQLGTLDDDLRLRVLSPCVDAGAIGPCSTYYSLAPTDNAGQPRLVDSLTCAGNDQLDIGALERQVLDGSTNFCPAAASSLGVPATLQASCAPSVAANDLVFSAQPLPDGCGLLFFGQVRTEAPFGDGVLCVGGRCGGLIRCRSPRSRTSRWISREPLAARSPPGRAGTSRCCTRRELRRSGLQPDRLHAVHASALVRRSAPAIRRYGALLRTAHSVPLTGSARSPGSGRARFRRWRCRGRW